MVLLEVVSAVETQIGHTCQICLTWTTSHLVQLQHFAPLALRQDLYLASQEVDDLKSVLDDADGHQLLAVVAAMHHHGVGKTLHDGTLGLAETLGSITPSGVREVLGVLLLHSNVIL